MKKIDACKLRRKGGFTLVELIVVLVLLSILSAVAVPTYLGFVDDNKAKQCETHRKALASRLEEMSAMGSDVELTDAMINGDENGCPAGGTYTLTGTADESDINSKTITCSIEEHGSTTVMLRNNSQVTAKSNTETEKKEEKQTEKTETNPPEPPTEAPAPKEPEFEVKIDPASQTINLSAPEPKLLTADVIIAEECSNTPDGYEWSASPSGIVSIDGDGKSVNVTAVGQGSCTVTCTATTKRDDGTGTISATSTASIKVESVSFSLPDEIMIPGWVVNETNDSINGNINTLLAELGYSIPAGGYWSSSDYHVICRVNDTSNGGAVMSYNATNGMYSGEDGYITIIDQHQGNSYPLTYTCMGESATTTVRVVYPINENGINANRDSVVLEPGQACQFKVDLYPWFTTDGPLEWECSDKEGNLVDCTFGGFKNTVVTLKAKAVGKTTITASVVNQYNTWKSGTEVRTTLSLPIEIKTDTYMTGNGLGIYINPSSISLVEGETASIKVAPEVGGAFTIHPTDPSEDLSGFKFSYESNRPKNASVDSNGTITALHEGLTSIQITAEKDGVSYVQAVTVNVTPLGGKLRGIRVEPAAIVLREGEDAEITMYPDTSGDVVVYPEPAGESLEGAETSIGLNANSHDIEISGNKITALSNSWNNSNRVDISVTKDGATYIGYARVTVTSNPGKFQIDGDSACTFYCTSWDVLKKHLQEGDAENLPTMYYDEAIEGGNSTKKYYLLRPGASISWKDEYGDITFSSFLMLPEIKDQFVEISPWNVFKGQSSNEFYKGRVFIKDKTCYVCDGSSSQVDANWSEEELLAHGFLRLTS